MATQKSVWQKDPKRAGDTPGILDTAYWKAGKPKAGAWIALAAASFSAALAVSWLVPPAQAIHPAPYRAVVGALILALAAACLAALGNPAFRTKLRHKAQFYFACGAALTLWDLLTAKSGLLPLPYFPSMTEIINVMFQDRTLLLRSTFYSMRLFFAGLASGTILGLATGVLIGWFRQWDYWLSPVIRVSGIVPAVAWLPVALLVFPNSFTTGMFLIFISSWFPVSSMMAAGITATPKSYFEAARTLGAGNRFLLFRVAIPNAMPSVFTGIMTACAFSFTTLIVSEMVGAKAGLGFYINWAKGWGAYAKVYGAIIIIAVEFSLILALLGTVRRSVLRWQRGIIR